MKNAASTLSILSTLLTLCLATACSDDGLSREEESTAQEQNDIEFSEQEQGPQSFVEIDISSALNLGGASSVEGGETWAMALAVDNQFDVYFGTPWQTEGQLVGQGDRWQSEFVFVAEGKKEDDHLYVVTTSDQGGAQGFVGVFSNVTRQKSVVTGDQVWEVFAAGAHPETNPHYPDPWPKSVLPTQEQVDRAITFAQEEGLWVDTFSDPAFDNDPDTDPTEGTPWSWQPWKHHYENVPHHAQWIWHDAGVKEDGRIPGPFLGSSQDEFLIFRVVGSTEARVR